MEKDLEGSYTICPVVWYYLKTDNSNLDHIMISGIEHPLRVLKIYIAKRPIHEIKFKNKIWTHPGKAGKE